MIFGEADDAVRLGLTVLEQMGLAVGPVQRMNLPQAKAAASREPPHGAPASTWVQRSRTKWASWSAVSASMAV